MADHAVTYNLSRFGLKEMTASGAEIRKLGAGAIGFEEVANRLVRHLYNGLVDDLGRPACALVRFFKTHPYERLSRSLQEFARQKVNPSSPAPADKCFVLVATAGERPEWNRREDSRRFKSIPLIGDQFVAQFPMFSQLLTQFGVNLHSFLQPGHELLVDDHETAFNVFHVEDAAGSPYIPLQEEFVLPYHIRSVLGFGSQMPSGDVFAVILFTKITIARDVADSFKTLALCAKIALLPFDGERLVIS